ncbi:MULTISPECIES: hypothetical protein [unclassified Nocardioides]|uniref:hypothetical protein n=1 Tax=unclassified Nocardioides TaxID=2615069 RepID=UPI0009F00D38|nr:MULTISPECIES: hypothetical protein [unclassified Nocardioides]GAW50189.1 hypothetical protein PD653B2_2520 [Nocardioides sp. PD653-B2]GAW53162.1 hypothetical protein PD653_0560 [Nocardioides sp. PD653]
MRKLLSVLAVLLCAAGFASAVPAPAQTAPAARAALPYEGHYRGMDQHHRTVTFTYTRAHGMTNFRVGHQSFGGAQVSGGRWHHTCHHGYCTRGQWHHDFYVTGHWNVSHGGGGDVFFEATHVS